MTDQQATELSHPRVGSFDDSAPFVATQLPSNFFCFQRAQQGFARHGVNGVRGALKMRFWANCRQPLPYRIMVVHTLFAAKLQAEAPLNCRHAVR
jgi:hypothetical protein